MRNCPRVGLCTSGPVTGVEQTNEFVASRIQLPGKCVAIQEPIQCLFFPDTISHPIAGSWKDRQQPSVLSAAERNSPVWNRENVLPEWVRRPKHLHHREIAIQPGAGVLRGGLGCSGFQIIRERAVRARPLCVQQRSDAHKGRESEQRCQMFHRGRGDYRLSLTDVRPSSVLSSGTVCRSTGSLGFGRRTASSPRVDGDRRPQRAADHLPRALRLAAGDDDVDVRWLVDRDHLVRLGLETRGVRLDASDSLGTQQLNRLIVPVFACGQQRVVGTPGNQLLLVSKPRSTKPRATIGSITKSGGLYCSTAARASASSPATWPAGRSRHAYTSRRGRCWRRCRSA